MRLWQRIAVVGLLGFIALLALLSLDDPTMEAPARHTFEVDEP